MKTDQTIENLEMVENEYDEEIIDEVLYDDEQYSEDESENMNNNQSDTEHSITLDFSVPAIQSENKFPCKLCEFSTNTVEYFHKHFDEKHFALNSDKVDDDDDSGTESMHNYEISSDSDVDWI